MLIPFSFFEELVKLGAVDADKAWQSYEALQNLDKNKPSVGQVGRYMGLGAVAAPAVNVLGSVIKGEKHFKPGVNPLRSLAGDAVKGALTTGAVPFIRQGLDRHAHEKTLKNYFQQKTAEESAPPPADNRMELGLGSLAAGGIAGAHAKPLITGRTRLYHGVASSAVPSVLEKGVQSAKDVGNQGVTSMLPNDIRDQARSLAYMTKSKGEAREYASQSKELGKFFKKSPDATQNQVVDAVTKLRGNPEHILNVANPLNTSGVISADVPLWRQDVASKMRPNPEARGGFRSYMNHLKATNPGVGLGLPPEGSLLQGLAEYPFRAIHSRLSNTVNLEGGVSPEFLHGSSKYKKLSLKEVGQYARAKPGRFGGGLALGAAGLGLSAYGAKKLLSSPPQAAEGAV